jgi:hypothetical protein
MTSAALSSAATYYIVIGGGGAVGQTIQDVTSATGQLGGAGGAALSGFIGGKGYPGSGASQAQGGGGGGATGVWTGSYGGTPLLVAAGGGGGSGGVGNPTAIFPGWAGGVYNFELSSNSSGTNGATDNRTGGGGGGYPYGGAGSINNTGNPAYTLFASGGENYSAIGVTFAGSGINPPNIITGYPSTGCSFSGGVGTSPCGVGGTATITIGQNGTDGAVYWQTY